MVLAGTHPATATQTEITSRSSQSPVEICNKCVYSEDQLKRVKSKLIGELSFKFFLMAIGGAVGKKGKDENKRRLLSQYFVVYNSVQLYCNIILSDSVST